jgi:hypothetical protein
MPKICTGMLTFFKTKRASRRHASPTTTAPVTPVVPAPERPSRSDRYLTDGVELYRLLGAVARGACELIGMENCRSLEIVLVPIAEFRDRWRTVSWGPQDSVVALAV